MDKENIKNKIIKYFDKTFIIGLLSIVCYYFIFNDFGTSLVLILRSMFTSLENNEIYAMYRALTNAVIYIFIFFVLIYLNKNYIKEDLNKYEHQEKLTYYVLIFTLISYVLTIVAAILQQKITNGLDIITSENQSSIDSILDYLSGFLIFAPITVFIAPIVEELIFRKSFFNVFKNKWVALVISAFIFGTIHVTTTYTLLLSKGYAVANSLYYTFGFGLSYYAMGLSFGLSYIKSDKNILVPIAIHMGNNFIATLFSVLVVPLIF